MLALSSAWLGLAVCILSATMVLYRPAFSDTTVPIALYGAVAAIGCGGLVLMRRSRPEDRQENIPAQQMQAKFGIALGMAAVTIVYALFSLAQRLPHAPG